MIAGFIITNIKDGFDIGKAKAQPVGIGGNILYVGGSGPNNYTSIQDAINGASDGDTVFVYNGTYYESISINKSINLIGEDKYHTIIDSAGSYHSNIEINADNVIIRGITTKRGNNYFRGDNIQINQNILDDTVILSGDNYTIGNNKIVGNLTILSSSNRIQYNTFERGVNLIISSLNLVSANNFVGKCDYPRISATGDGNIIQNNTIEKGTVGISAEGDANIIQNNIIQDCETGILLRGNTKKGFHDNLIIVYNNTIKDNGIGILCKGIKESWIKKNSISGCDIAGIKLHYDTHPPYSRIYGCNDVRIEENVIDGISWYGVGIWIDEYRSSLYERPKEDHNGIDIIKNKIINSQDSTGISIWAGNAIVRKNTIYYGEGIYYYSEGIKGAPYVYHNNFIDNIQPIVSPSYAPLTRGTFYNKEFREGNYWSDYNGTDLNGDGIGDTPYIITENVVDPYPLMKKSENYIHSPTCSLSANPSSGYAPLGVTLLINASDIDGLISSWLNIFMEFRYR